MARKKCVYKNFFYSTDLIKSPIEIYLFSGSLCKTTSIKIGGFQRKIDYKNQFLVDDVVVQINS
jgi:hypothetical protein